MSPETWPRLPSHPPPPASPTAAAQVQVCAWLGHSDDSGGAVLHLRLRLPGLLRLRPPGQVPEAGLWSDSDRGGGEDPALADCLHHRTHSAGQTGVLVFCLPLPLSWLTVRGRQVSCLLSSFTSLLTDSAGQTGVLSSVFLYLSLDWQCGADRCLVFCLPLPLSWLTVRGRQVSCLLSSFTSLLTDSAGQTGVLSSVFLYLSLDWQCGADRCLVFCLPLPLSWLTVRGRQVSCLLSSFTSLLTDSAGQTGVLSSVFLYLSLDWQCGADRCLVFCLPLPLSWLTVRGRQVSCLLSSFASLLTDSAGQTGVLSSVFLYLSLDWQCGADRCLVFCLPLPLSWLTVRGRQVSCLPSSFASLLTSNTVSELAACLMIIFFLMCFGNVQL